MQARTICVFTIRPDPSRPLAMDLKHILAALDGAPAAWVWCVRGVDVLGEGAEAFCEAVEAAGPGGLWVESDDLLSIAAGIYQTIEGTFLAFPEGTEPGMIPASDLDLASFPTSPAVLAIVAVDGSWFDVYVKDPDLATRIEALPGTTADDPRRFF